MQDNFRSNSHFFERTNLLASVFSVNLKELPRKIGISERMFYGYRTAKYPVTAKVWLKLEAAERAAGIGVKRVEEALEHEGNAECAGKLNDSPPPYGKNLSIEERLEALEAENAMLKSGLAEVFEALRPMFSESRPKKYSSEEPS